MNTEKILGLQKMMLRKREIEAELKRLNKSIADLEGQVLDDMAGEGVHSVTLGDATMYILRQVFVGVEDGVERAEVAQRLKGAGLGGYVQENFNLNSLSAYYRESGEEPVQGLKLTEKFKIGMRKV